MGTLIIMFSICLGVLSFKQQNLQTSLDEANSKLASTEQVIREKNDVIAKQAMLLANNEKASTASRERIKLLEAQLAQKVVVKQKQPRRVYEASNDYNFVLDKDDSQDSIKINVQAQQSYLADAAKMRLPTIYLVSLGLNATKMLESIDYNQSSQEVSPRFTYKLSPSLSVQRSTDYGLFVGATVSQQSFGLLLTVPLTNIFGGK